MSKMQFSEVIVGLNDNEKAWLEDFLSPFNGDKYDQREDWDGKARAAEEWIRPRRIKRVG